METPEDLSEVLNAFQSHRDRLLRLVDRRLNPVMRARVSPEDVLQEAAAAVAKSGGSFVANKDLPVYFRLRTVVIRTITALERTHLLAGKRDAYREVHALPPDAAGDDDDDAPSPIDDQPDTATSPRSAVARSERHDLLRQAIRELSPADRQIVTLRNFDDLPNNDCAAILGIEPATASIRYVRALRRLKDILAQHTEFRNEQ